MAEITIGSGLGFGYAGNLHIKCAHCGKIRTFHSREEIEELYCFSCKRKTALIDLKQVYYDCECGNHTGYKTNMSGVFDIECYNCGAPVDFEPAESRVKDYVNGGYKRIMVYKPMGRVIKPKGSKKKK